MLNEHADKPIYHKLYPVGPTMYAGTYDCAAGTPLETLPDSASNVFSPRTTRLQKNFINAFAGLC